MGQDDRCSAQTRGVAHRERDRIVCALGARDLLVGRSHECDFPPDVRHLPALTKPKFSVTGTSCDIDTRVKAILQEGLSVLDARTIHHSAEPDRKGE